MRFININSKGKVNNERPYFATGTSLQGYINVDYKKLVEVFGEPNGEDDGYKVDSEWIIFTLAGVATIYNYKDGKNYLGEEGLEVEEITDWHIGGKDKEVVEWITRAINKQHDRRT